MPIKCIIIDDEPLAIQIIKSYVAKIPDLELLATFQNPMNAFEFLQQQEVGLIFLDIQMPLLTGIDFIKSLSSKPAFIFTTAHRNHAVESYELSAIDYLLKPITFSRFFQAVNKFTKITPQKQLNTNPIATQAVHDHLYVNANKKYIKILFEEVLYVESIKDYVRIHTIDQQIMTKDKLSAFGEKLPQHFLRIHRSFIVNTEKLTAFTAKDVEIETKELPIGERYKQQVMDYLKEG